METPARTKLMMKPGERGRLTIEAKVPVIEDSVVWKDYAAETVTLDHGDKHTPLDIAVVAGSVGIAIIEAQVLTEDGERVLEHTFEIEVVNTATDDDLIGHARLSRESPTFEGVTPEPEPQPEIPSATEIEEAENATVSPMPTAEPEPVAAEAEAEPVAEPAPEPEAPVDGSDMMAGFQADAEANAALESPLTDTEGPAAETEAEAAPAEAEADEPIDEGNVIEEPITETTAETPAETSAVDEEPVVDEGNTETVEEPTVAEESAESAEETAPEPVESEGETVVEGGVLAEGDQPAI